MAKSGQNQQKHISATEELILMLKDTQVVQLQDSDLW
jgi:hypothetical protein